MSRYKQSSPVPWIMAVALVAVFVGIVVFATRDPGPEQATHQGSTNAPIGDPVPEAREEPPADEPADAPGAVPEPPAFTADEAEQALRRATAAWRAFTLELCRKQKWPSKRAVAFLEKVTWNDRDKAKQHAQGLASIRRMLETDTKDPVALAEALRAEGSLAAFFEKSWPKVDVEWKPEPEVKALEDAWKPKRIQWGFPLDTPVDTLQEFKVVQLAGALNAWQALVVGAVGQLEIDNAAKSEKARAALGASAQQREAKMHAGLAALLDMTDGSVKDVVQEFHRRSREAADRKTFIATLATKMDAALTAAEKVE